MGANCGKGGNAGVPEASHRPSAMGKARTTSSVGSRGQYIVQNTSDIRSVYEIAGEKIGEGTFGAVRLGTHRATGVVRAIKAVAKSNPQQVEALRKEVATMKMLDHPHIIQLFETFEDRRCVYLAMELCSGGELFDRVIAVGSFSEPQAATVMQQILKAVFYLHDNNIAHRDLKPENFLFLNRNPISNNCLKLIDFGTSCPCSPGEVLKMRVGTSLYMAPQVVIGRYNKQCDLWSVGVIMYILLSGQPPFSGKTDQEIIEKVRAGQWKFRSDTWTHVSDDAKDLIRNLMRMNVQTRHTAEQALNHDWIKDHAPRAAELQLESGVIDRLRGFSVHNRLQKAVLNIVAGQLDEEKIVRLRETFESLDANGDGKLTVEELTAGLERAGVDMTDVDPRQLMAKLDANGSGALDYTEFIAATLDRKTLLTEDLLWTAFNVFDHDGDGKISRGELRNMLSENSVNDNVGVMRLRSLKELIAQGDKNGDGNIDFEEFVAMVRDPSVLSATSVRSLGSIPSSAARMGA